MMSAYSQSLHSLTDREYLEETFDQIDRANQSPIWSAADSRASECCKEGQRRNRPDLYQRAFEAAYAAAKGDERYRRTYDAMLEAV